MSKYISVTDTAKLVRVDLKKAFPRTKFSVRSHSYSGGASIDVSWTDGPTSTEVDHVVSKYSGSTFDGMIDLRSYHTSDLNGETVHFGADHVFTQREFSPAFIQRCAEVTCAYFDHPVPTLNNRGYFTGSADIPGVIGRYSLHDSINQVMYVTNADDETLHGGWGRVEGWIEAVWLAAKNSSDVDTTPAPQEDDLAWQWAGVEAYESKPALREGAEYTPDGGVVISFDLILQMAAETDAEANYEQDIDKAMMSAWEENEGVNRDFYYRNWWAQRYGEPSTYQKSIESCRQWAEVENRAFDAQHSTPKAPPDTLRERLASVDANALSPLEALTLIYELKRLA